MSLDFFTDPVLRAPTWGTLFMCVASSLMGVLLFLKKKTLLSESLSHATYPGIVIGAMIVGVWLPASDSWSFGIIVLSAFTSSFLALKLIGFLQEKQKLHPDSALCFVLALFFGVGIVATSVVQSLFPSMQRQMLMLLFGQAATMTDTHIYLYGSLAVLVGLVIFLMFHPLRAFSFDRDFAQGIGIRVLVVEKILFWFLLLSLILGIRSVGVVLMSGMVIAPAVAARQFTNHLHKMFFLSAIFGAASGVLGNVLSVFGTLALSTDSEKLTLPTGPMIILVGGFFAFFSLCFAPERGWVFRKVRAGSFRIRCLEENILKGMWKKGEFSRGALKSYLGVSSFPLFIALRRLVKHGWIDQKKGAFYLTRDGMRKAASVIRLHRLWELYLADTLKLHLGKVHQTAEEMEHILTPDIEERLMTLLSNPTKDPHHQPIPERLL